MLAVKRFVFAIYKNTCDDKNHNENRRENQLTLCKHCGYFSGKGNDSGVKFGYFAAS